MPHHNANPQTILAFDVGLKRTGVAVGQTLTKTAQPAANLAVKNGQLPWQQLDELINTWQPHLCVVGDSKSDDPHLNKLTRRLIHYLQSHHRLSVTRIDEAYTTASANQELDGSGLNIQRKTELRDQLAACLILESYFSECNVINRNSASLKT